MGNDHKQEQLWRSRYRENRYARHLNEGELIQRLRDVFLNLNEFSDDAKVGPSAWGKGEFYWPEMFAHVLEEVQCRHGPYPLGIPKKLYPDNDFFPNIEELGDKAAAALSSHKLNGEDVLIKFGKKRYMESLFDKGSIRIQPANFFSTRGHNSAIHDDELSMALSVVVSPDEVRSLVVNPESVSDGMKDQRVDVNLKHPENLWLYCLTPSVNARLFLDFEADACVIIKDKKYFSEMLQKKSKAAFPDAIMDEGAINYVDPLLPETANIFVPLAKHFRYSYQDEYRFYWIDPTQRKGGSHIDIEIGSLEQCAELVVL